MKTSTCNTSLEGCLNKVYRVVIRYLYIRCIFSGYFCNIYVACYLQLAGAKLHEPLPVSKAFVVNTGSLIYKIHLRYGAEKGVGATLKCFTGESISLRLNREHNLQGHNYKKVPLLQIIYSPTLIKEIDIDQFPTFLEITLLRFVCKTHL